MLESMSPVLGLTQEQQRDLGIGEDQSEMETVTLEEELEESQGIASGFLNFLMGGQDDE